MKLDRLVWREEDDVSGYCFTKEKRRIAFGSSNNRREDTMTEFTPAWYLTQMLKRHNVLQKDAAIRMGISAAYLSDMLHGRRRIGPEIVELAVERIETTDKDAARRDLHRLGAAADGWIINEH